MRVATKELPLPTVFAVTQDAQGFIWAGTPGGLARYDGYHFRSFLPDASEPFAPSGVESLLADARNRLWIGTPSSGLAMLDESTGTFRAWHADPNGRTGPRSPTVIALAQTPDGRLLVGGDSGLDVFDPSTNAFSPMNVSPGDAQPRVEAITIGRDHTVWVATVRGLYYRTERARSFTRVVSNRFTDFTNRGFFCLYVDSNDRLWAGSLNAVFVLDRRARVVETYAAAANATALGLGEQWGVMEVTPGTFWVASYDSGISIVDDRTHRVRRIAVDRANPAGLTPGDVWQFFRDRSGLIWIANGPGGLLAYNPLNSGIYELSSSDRYLGAGDLGARAVAAGNDGSLWLGGSQDVVRLSPRTDALLRLSVPGHPSIQTMSTARDGTLLIGTMRGVCRLSPGIAAIACPSGAYESAGRVFAMVDDGRRLWIGSGSGLTAWNERSGSERHYRHRASPATLSNDFVTVLYEDRRGRVWAGTTFGLNRIDPKTNQVTRFVHDPANANSIGDGSISSIVEDRFGRIWAGAVGGPLNVLTERPGGSEQIRRLGRSDGVPENVDGLAAGLDGAIWASASNAIARIDPQTFRARSIGPAEGVQETEFWTRGVSQAPDGTIFFAGTYAVTVIAPGAKAQWTYAPPLAVTALKIGNRSVPAWSAGAAPIELPAGERDLSVEFSALDYSAPDALHYAYALDGYNRNWIEADPAHRIATYTNLAPGDYTLRVRATNRLGVWSTNAIALHVRALPAWHETVWFRALLALVGILAIVAIVRARTELLRRRAERLEELVAERTSELAQANTALEKMTITDPLTGLHNRRFLMQRIDEDVALAIRQQTDLVFFLVDIDHFKSVNDELGHAAGDRVLAQMRERLEEVFRASDYVLRWGGEEFLAVTRGSSRADASEIAERLREAIARRPFTLDGGQPLIKTASIGFAAFPFVPSQQQALSWLQVVELADQALYLAKHGGRNAWYGLESTERTDGALLAQRLASSPEEAVANGNLRVVSAANPLVR